MTRLDAPAAQSAHPAEGVADWAERAPRWPLRVHLGTLAAAAVFLILVDRDQWFSYDEFMFLGYRRDHMPSVLAEYLAPHYGHWSTVPLAFYQLVRNTLGLQSYWPYLLALFTVHLAATHLLWRLSQRVGSGPWVATALSAAFAVLGAGWENLVWAFQVGSVGSVLLGFAGLLTVTGEGLTRRRWWLVALVLLLNLATSGVGLVFLVVTAFVTAIWHGVRAVRCTVAPALAYAAWLACFGANPSKDAWPGPLWQLPVGYLSFIGTGLTSSAAHLLGNSDFVTKAPVLLGAAPLMAFAISTYRLGKHGQRRERVAGVVAAGAVFFYAICGIARVGLGADQARAGRYTYLAVALCLPALALLLTRLARRDRRLHVGVVALCVVMVIGNAVALAQLGRRMASGSADIRGNLFAAARLVDAGEPHYVGALLSPTSAPTITMDDVWTWRRRGLWPDAPTISAEDRASASLDLQIRYVPSSRAVRAESCTTVNDRHPRSFTIHAHHEITHIVLTRTQNVGLRLTTPSGVTSRWRLDELNAGTWAVQSLLPGGTLAVAAADDDATTLRAC